DYYCYPTDISGDQRVF
nr:immunoglobulin light chain junction region [Macaca mulatta]